MELLTSILFAAALAAGQATPSNQPAAAQASGTPDTDERVRVLKNFPNEIHRQRGADHAARGDWNDALREFTQAARYADKYSQHQISLMYWQGNGVQRDRALAYAWADLAAERLYPGLVVLREKMWLELDEAQRQRAVREGGALYDEYGDKVAKPRLAAVIARQNARVTGSRTGYVDGRLAAYGPGQGTTTVADRSTGYDTRAMYEPWRMDPARYWEVEDTAWKNGNVEVGPAQKDGAGPKPAEQ